MLLLYFDTNLQILKLLFNSLLIASLFFIWNCWQLPFYIWFFLGQHRLTLCPFSDTGPSNLRVRCIQCDTFYNISVRWWKWYTKIGKSSSTFYNQYVTPEHFLIFQTRANVYLEGQLFSKLKQIWAFPQPLEGLC